MRKILFFLFLMAGGLIFVGQAQAQQTTSSNTYSLPESYYNSQNQPQPSTGSQPVSVSTSSVSTEPAAPANAATPAPQAAPAAPEPAPAPVEDKPVAGYDGGFFIQDKTGDYKLVWNGRLQVQGAVAAVEDVEDANSMSVRRSFFVFSGNLINEKLTYVIVDYPLAPVNFVTGEFSYAFLPEFNVTLGLDTIDINYMLAVSSGKLDFMAQSIESQKFNLDDSIGIWLSGSLWKFGYWAGVFNGIGTVLDLNANQELAYGGNISFTPLAPYSGSEGDPDHTDKVALFFRVGGGFGHYEDGTQAKVIMGTAFAGFKFQGVTLAAQGSYRYTDPNQFIREQTDLGYTVQASYYIIPKKLSFGLRHSALLDDISDVGVNLNMQGGRLSALKGIFTGSDVDGDSDNEYEYSAAINYDFKGFAARIQAQYALVIDGIPGPDDRLSHIAMLQTQVGF